MSEESDEAWIRSLGVDNRRGVGDLRMPFGYDECRTLARHAPMALDPAGQCHAAESEQGWHCTREGGHGGPHVGHAAITQANVWWPNA